MTPFDDDLAQLDRQNELLDYNEGRNKDLKYLSIEIPKPKGRRDSQLKESGRGTMPTLSRKSSQHTKNTQLMQTFLNKL